jgi:hypothetical protein
VKRHDRAARTDQWAAPDTLLTDPEWDLVHDQLLYAREITPAQLAVLSDLVLRLRTTSESP